MIALVILSFKFRFLSAFIPWLKYSDFQLSTGNFRQRITSKHTVNANELGTHCTSGIIPIKMCIIDGDRP